MKRFLITFIMVLSLIFAILSIVGIIVFIAQIIASTVIGNSFNIKHLLICIFIAAASIAAANVSAIYINEHYKEENHE